MGLSGLLLLNVTFLALGVGVIGLFRAAGNWADLVAKLGLAYLAGVCIAGLAAAELAIVNVSIGAVTLALVAASVLVAGLVRFARGLAPVGMGPRGPILGGDVSAFWIADLDSGFQIQNPQSKIQNEGRHVQAKVMASETRRR